MSYMSLELCNFGHFGNKNNGQDMHFKCIYFICKKQHKCNICFCSHESLRFFFFDSPPDCSRLLSSTFKARLVASQTSLLFLSTVTVCVYTLAAVTASLLHIKLTSKNNTLYLSKNKLKLKRANKVTNVVSF